MDICYNNGIILLLLTLPLSIAALSMSKSKTTNCCDATKAHLLGKNVILTGASSGLGRSLAFQLSQCHINKLVLSGRNIAELEKVKSRCEEIMISNNYVNDNEKKCNIEIVPCDLADEKSVDIFSNDAMKLCNDEVDVLILCGGISSRSSFLETKIDVDKLLMQVNFISGAAIAKRIVPSMVSRKGGNIIWISSVQGLLGTPFRTSYAASKFAVQGYCEAVRSEVASSGVRVSCISPGYIRTNLSHGAIRGDGSKHGQLDETTAKGADPDLVATQILDSVMAAKRTDFIVAATISAKFALILKFFAPSILEKLLVKRFKKAV